MKDTIILYRYERDYVNDEDGLLLEYRISLREYEVWKTTPCGYWIYKPYHKSQKGKFILSGTNGRRFAYDTKRAAWESFRIRTRKSLMHCKGALKRAEIFAEMLKKGNVKKAIQHQV